jgi:hypothetical protein
VRPPVSAATATVGRRGLAAAPARGEAEERKQGRRGKGNFFRAVAVCGCPPLARRLGARGLRWGGGASLLMLCAFVLMIPNMDDAAKQGWNVSFWAMDARVNVIVKDLYVAIDQARLVGMECESVPCKALKAERHFSRSTKASLPSALAEQEKSFSRNRLSIAEMRQSRRRPIRRSHLLRSLAPLS